VGEYLSVCAGKAVVGTKGREGALEVTTEAAAEKGAAATIGLSLDYAALVENGSMLMLAASFPTVKMA